MDKDWYHKIDYYLIGTTPSAKLSGKRGRRGPCGIIPISSGPADSRLGISKKLMVTIVFSANEGHAMLLGIAFCSLFENKKGDYPMQIYVLDGGIAAVNKERAENSGISLSFFHHLFGSGSVLVCGYCNEFTANCAFIIALRWRVFFRPIAAACFIWTVMY